jgi:hypothetical protein
MIVSKLCSIIHTNYRSVNNYYVDVQFIVSAKYKLSW